MRILHVYKDYYPVLGGIENHIRLLADGQAARGHQVAVLVTSLTPRTTVEDRGGVRVIKAGRAVTLSSTPVSLSFPIYFARLRPDITHLHFPYPLGELAHLLLGRGRPTVLTYHSDVVRQRGWLRLRRVLRRADRIIATSPHYVASSPYLREVANRCRVIPLGVETVRFARADLEAVGTLRARFGGPLLLFVGRLRYYKGLPHLLQALQGLPEARLLVVGDGPMQGAWEAETQRLGLADRVHFLGEVPEGDLPAYYHACDLFVLPADQRSEAFGAVLLEAMASGRPVVSTELGTGTSWVNRHGETGWVVPPADPEPQPRDMRTDVCAAALAQGSRPEARRWAQEFDVQVLVDRVLALYEEVLEAAGRAVGREG